MLIEQLIFTIIAFSLFVAIFTKMILKNDTSYITILIIQTIGIVINFLEVLFQIKINTLLFILKYIFAIFLPILILVLEKNGKSYFAIINLLKAKFYLKCGNNKKAKKILIKLTTKKPENAKAHRFLAELYEKEGGTRKAIDEYVQVIDNDKTDYASYFKIADLLYELDKKDEAAEMLTNLLNKKPDYQEATQILGEILIETQKYKEAAIVYQEGLKYNPLSYELNYNLGIAYTMLNDFQNAKICYERAAQINSLEYNCKYYLAQIALIYKDIEEANRYFMQTKDIDELSADSYFELSKISLIKQDKEMAIHYINTAIDIDAFKIIPKVKKDPIFIPIMAKISFPFNIEEREDLKKLQPKEIDTKDHLEEMADITRHLSYDDIHLLKKNKSKPKKIEKSEKERHS